MRIGFLKPIQCRKDRNRGISWKGLEIPGSSPHPSGKFFLSGGAKNFARGNCLPSPPPCYEPSRKSSWQVFAKVARTNAPITKIFTEKLIERSSYEISSKYNSTDKKIQDFSGTLNIGQLNTCMFKPSFIIHRVQNFNENSVGIAFLFFLIIFEFKLYQVDFCYPVLRIYTVNNSYNSIKFGSFLLYSLIDIQKQALDECC